MRFAPSKRLRLRHALNLLAIFAVLLVGCHKSVEELTHFHGKIETAVITELGKPTVTNIMTLRSGVELPELYVEIHNTYDPSDDIDGIEIKELRWDRFGYTEAVFMHRVDGVWTVLESCRWKDRVKF